MIRPEGFRGAAFGAALDGDARSNEAARSALSAALDIASDWAVVTQVHGAHVVEATNSGHHGEADGIFSAVPGLPLAVATADCVPIVLEGPDVAAVVHAGWRGLDAGIIPAVLGAIEVRRLTVERAAIGPAIGPCCYEVGDDVADRFGEFVAATTAGSTSVDLEAIAAYQLGDLKVWRAGTCTMCGEGYHSYRRDATADRQVTLAWLP